MAELGNSDEEAIEDPGIPTDVAPFENQLIQLLADFDDALIEGSLSSASLLLDSPIPVELAEILDKDRSFLALLHEMARAGGDARSEKPSSQVSLRHVSVPKILGRFEIVRELGHGAQGVVFLGFDSALKRSVAVKVPRWESLVRPEHKRRFQREAEILARLTHPNIVAVHEVGREDLIWYIASDYCQGPTLAEWLKQHVSAAPILKSVKLIETLALAVHYAHDRGIIHRDLKPGNVILTRDGVQTALSGNDASDLSTFTPKLMDFGLAKLDDDVDTTRTGLVLGTPAYMSPEQAEGKAASISPATDIYSLGAMLYELLTGSPPIVGTSEVDTLRKIGMEDPLPPSRRQRGITRDLDAICLKCLQKKPSSRYATAAALAEDLARYRNGLPILARRASRLEGAAKWCWRHPAGSTLIVLLTVLALIVPALSIATNQRLQGLLDDAETERKRAQENEAAALAGIERAELDRNAANMRLGLELLRYQDTRLSSILPLASDSSKRRFDERFEWRFLQRHQPKELMRAPAHRHRIRFLQASADGKLLFTAAGDNLLKVWGISEREPRRVFDARYMSDACLPYAISHGANLIAFTATGRDVTIAEPLTGREIYRFSFPVDVSAIAFSPDDSLVAIGGLGTIGVYRWPNGETSWEIKSWQSDRPALNIPAHLRFSHDNNRLFALSFGEPSLITVLDSENGQQAGTFPVSWWDALRQMRVRTEVLSNAATMNPARVDVGHLQRLNLQPFATSPSFSISFDASIEQRRAVAVDVSEQVTMFDLNDGRKLRSWTNASGARPVSTCMVGPTSLVAVGLDDGTLVVWESSVPTYPVEILPGPKFQPMLDAGKAGTYVVAVDHYRQLWYRRRDAGRQWELLGQCQNDPLDIAILPDGQRLAVLTQDSLELWKIKSKECVASTQFPTISSGKLSASTSAGTELLATGASPRELTRWRVCDEPEDRTKVKNVENLSTKEDITAFSLSADDNSVFIATSDHRIRQLNINTGHELGLPMETGDIAVTALVASKDGRHLAFGKQDGSTGMIELPKGRILWQYHWEKLKASNSEVKNLDFSPDGKTLFSMRSELVAQQVQHGAPVWQIPDEVNQFAVPCDGDSLFVLHHEGQSYPTVSEWSHDGWTTRKLEGWSPARLDQLVTVGNTDLLAVSDTLRTPLNFNHSDQLVRRWYVPMVPSYACPQCRLGDHVKLYLVDQFRERTWPGEVPIINARSLLAGAHQKPWLAAGGRDGAVEAWDVVSGKQLARMFTNSDAERIATTSERMSALGAAYFPEYDYQGESVTSIKFAPMDRQMAIGGRVGSCRIYDTGTWKMVGQRTFPACVSFIAFSKVEDSVAIGFGHFVETWNSSLRQRRQSIELAAAGEVACGIMTEDGKRLIVGCKSREIVVLDLITGKPVEVLSAHTGAITALALSPDGKTLVSTSIDGSIRLWDMETLRDIGILGRHIRRANGVVFSTDGNTLYSVGDGDDNGRNVFLIWNAEDSRRANP